ncbi:DegT/DnrJ/EryC1/StrS aminotransferase family protein [Burkholderia sp. D-99]|uniref:DegT/DnrJ/EryC1/StrS family aminotransferase n=1 Tax=Burkholderia sp. D-99 TaxID=2717316 RepID=UPI001420B535|nr:DegT/DnrJ/EryC1/StrS aminotransferase family protein [Burkholderia sp. D-99]NHV29701.1 DegT/DnrJ/EryC1/StrS aminotransferase family protein [Burkholderia sp. D-99]
MTDSLTPIKFAQPELDELTIEAVADVLRSRHLTSGPKTQAFEDALSATFGGRPTRVVTSATAAIELALQICGVGPGDEVITSAQSFFSTMNMIVKCGAVPTFVDCDLESRAIDLEQVERAITARTKAIMPTHFPGSLVDMDALMALASKYGLRVVEDAALVQGSHWQGRPIGSFGDVTTFSFHPNKNMTTIEGGAIVVNSEEEAKRIDALRFHGIRRLPDGTRDVESAAGKFNMSDVSAAIGLRQLQQLEGFLEKRETLVSRYFQKFPEIAGAVLPPRAVPRQSWNMFCVLFPFSATRFSRHAFRNELERRGILSGVSYEALHTTSLGRKLGYAGGQFPNAERIARETVTLPLHVGMTEENVDRVCRTVAEVWHTL